MTKSPLLLGSAVALLALGACTDPYSQGYNGNADPNANTRGGAITGALIGGAIGASSGGDERLTKAAAGAIVGGLIGGAIGNQLDRQAQELRRDLDTNGVSVVNTGNQLVVTMPQDVLFATDSSSVRPDLQRDLYTLAGSLNRYPDTTVEVIGHTDADGDASYNQRLSEARARSVADILVGAGVPRQRVVAYGRGEDQPVASNYTPEGKAQNRRVEFIIRPNQ
ncbi:outer membrane protein OmpA-like peptidoglycan-associated protein [Rhodobacter aestuarii]|uniref:Outer membrane protein OmpA n=1 Tax=Rhodobacter aestuarii TaxID=453582 RepID=A0A1N7JMW0_9RHOB|nr:OmpA family protein [Rhodobacter aestuarii]PTV96064.1 outer membrane protein OmpA-like peptidoglycan-associated protein [Rhodobacter aestuarii]SIS50703.1 Outer membrane protein OmpA [Rhodobacter aestuarii]